MWGVLGKGMGIDDRSGDDGSVTAGSKGSGGISTGSRARRCIRRTRKAEDF